MRMFPSATTATLAAVLTALTACGTADPAAERTATPEGSDEPAPYRPDASHLPAPIAAVYEAHTAELPGGRAIAYDLDLHFGGSQRFDGRITQSVAMDRIDIDRAADGMQLRYDGDGVAMIGDTAAGEPWPGARFDVFTWPYFFAAPFKLADPGTQWGEVADYPWSEGAPATAAKLTFAAGTGDAPDDYYVVVPGDDGLVEGMAYVVTFGKGTGAADEADPHAIVYSDYREVDGVPIAHRWEFHNWNAEDGLGAEVIGYADLADVAWVEAAEESFATEGGVAVEMP